jgi:hypothetical protein
MYPNNGSTFGSIEKWMRRVCRKVAWISINQQPNGGFHAFLNYGKNPRLVSFDEGYGARQMIVIVNKDILLVWQMKGFGGFFV